MFEITINRFLRTVVLSSAIWGVPVVSGLRPLPLKAQAPGVTTARIDSLLAEAERGDVDAQHEYGRLHVVGEGVPVDYQVAMEWYARAAERDHTPSILLLSTLLIASDPVEAIRLVVRAAELGVAEAQWRAGQVYAGRIFFPGSEIDMDQVAALRWFEMGAAQGHHPSEEALADMYTNTDDPSRYGDAVALYRRAAGGGESSWAVMRLGMIFATGEGAEESDDNARGWFATLASGYELDPEFFSNAELDVLGGLQAYYGLDFVGGDASPDPGVAIESFNSALDAARSEPVNPFIHSSFRRTSERMLRKLLN
jgi:hypothetical protein